MTANQLTIADIHRQRIMLSTALRLLMASYLKLLQHQDQNLKSRTGWVCKNFEDHECVKEQITVLPKLNSLLTNQTTPDQKTTNQTDNQ